MLSIPLVPLVLTSLLGLTGASPIASRSPYAVKDSHRVPQSWIEVGTPAADHTIYLTISLKQGRFTELENHLLESSDPFHPRYGQHLTKAEVDELVKPSAESLHAVQQWLSDHDIDSVEFSASRDTIKFALPLSEVEELLDTEYSVYEHIDGTRLVRTTEYSLPVHLHEHITIVTPTNQFLRSDPRGKKYRTGGAPLPFDLPAEPAVGSVDAVCNFSLVTPTCLRTIYGTLNYTAQVPGKNKVALNDFLGELNLRSDASLFLEMFRPDAVAGASEFTQISIAGGTVQQTLNETELENQTGIEGDLDAETILGISYPTPLTIYATGGLDPSFMPDLQTPTNSDEPYLTWVNFVLATEDIPQVISTSYGDDEQTVSYAYAAEVCNKYAQFGARGVSLLYASGDFGVGADGTCVSNDGLNTTEFLPSFPCDCPYVTNVGATAAYPEVAAFDARFAGQPFTSGAGFSNYFPMPSWQKKAVEAYIASLDGEYDGLYNKSGRAYPDIAALGQIYATVWNGTVIQVDGTSAATPAAAGVLTLVNDALIAAGKPTLGFLNPWLYAYGYKAFTDVVSGSSAGCNTSGFPAQVGWDAVTGWGTPYFPDIVALLGVGEGKGWEGKDQ